MPHVAAVVAIPVCCSFLTCLPAQEQSTPALLAAAGLKASLDIILNEVNTAVYSRK